MCERKKQQLWANYYEHFKYGKELALIYPLNHKKRVKIDNAMNDIIEQIKQLNK